MKMNKDVPREEQLRIVLQNYDRKQEECDALKRENENLKKQLERKDVLYKNMVKTLTEKNDDEAKGEKKWEREYKALKNMYAQRGEKVCNQNTKINKLSTDLRTAQGELDYLQGKLREVLGQFNNAHSILTSCCAKAQVYLASDLPKDAEQPTQEAQGMKFIRYIREVISIYHDTGTLRGISVLASRYGVSSLSKEQFFRFGFDSEDEISDRDILKAYPQAKKH